MRWLPALCGKERTKLRGRDQSSDSEGREREGSERSGKGRHALHALDARVKLEQTRDERIDSVRKLGDALGGDAGRKERNDGTDTVDESAASRPRAAP